LVGNAEEANSKNTTDPGQFLKLPLWKIMKSSDCMYCDGAYIFVIDEMVEKMQKQNIQVNSDNFFCPIRKERNIELSECSKISKKVQRNPLRYGNMVC